MTRLDYNEDNFFGTASRGQRFDILMNGERIYHDVSEMEVDILCEQVQKHNAYLQDVNVEAIEI